MRFVSYLVGDDSKLTVLGWQIRFRNAGDKFLANAAKRNQLLDGDDLQVVLFRELKQLVAGGSIARVVIPGLCSCR